LISAKVIFIGALAVAMSVLVSPVLPASAATTCQAQNQTAGGAAQTDLQQVIDTASAGDSLSVEGICVGNFKIDKPLTLVGITTSSLPTPTLDGNLQSWTLFLSHPRDTTVTLQDLTITRGAETSGAGIFNGDGSLELTGSTTVTSNAGYNGGGILSFGALTLNDTSSVTGNSVSGKRSSGGGVYSVHLVTLNDSASVSDNTADDGIGGGIYTEAEIALNDSAVVERNSALHGGSVYQNFGLLVLHNSASIAGHAVINGGGVGGRGTIVMNGESSISGVSDGNGGGISHARYGTITLNGEATISGTAGALGGAVLIGHGGVTMNQHSDNQRRGRQGWWSV